MSLRIGDEAPDFTTRHKVATPVNWKRGNDAIITGSVSDEDARRQFPTGGAQAVPANRAATGIGYTFRLPIRRDAMKPRMLLAWCAGAFLAAADAAPSWAQDRTAARNLASACFTCHGTDGRSVGGVPPSLAGQDRNLLLQALREFKAGKRPATIMHQQAKGYTDQELEILADYFAGVKGGTAAAPSSRY